MNKLSKRQSSFAQPNKVTKSTFEYITKESSALWQKIFLKIPKDRDLP